MKKFILPLLLVLPLATHAGIYQCQVDGRTVFTDRPCSGPGHEVDIGIQISAPDVGAQDFGAVNAGIRDRLAARSDKRKISKLDSKVRKANKKINGYRAQMDSELSVWRRPGEHAAIRGYWDSKVSDQERALAGYYREIDALKSK